jgi:O-methyltransferase StaMB
MGRWTPAVLPESRAADVGQPRLLNKDPGVRIARLTDARVTGISVSREQIKIANSFAESTGLAQRVVFQCANAMEPPFPAQSFDAAIALESIVHMPDCGQVLT